MFTHKCLEGTYLCLTTSFSTWKCKHKLSKGFEVFSYAEVPAEQGVLSWGRKVPAVLEEQECKEAETEDTSFNPLSFACARSLVESIGGLCPGMPGKLLAWPVSIVQASLSASSVGLTCWALPCQGWMAGSECSRKSEIKQKSFCSHPQCCCAQEEMLLQPKHLNWQWRYQICPHQLFLGKVSSADKSSTAKGHQKYPKRILQAKKAQNMQCSMHSLQARLFLHGPSLPLPSDYILLSLTGWLYTPALLWACPIQTLPGKVYWAFNDC